MKKLVLLSLALSAMLAASTAAADRRFPDFPVPAKMSAAAKVGQRVYAGLGSAGQAWYALDLSTPGAPWQAQAPFPDQPREHANAVAIGSAIYVFNGQGRPDPLDSRMIVFDTVWKFDTVANAWSQVATRSPMGGLAAGAATLDGRGILFFGGANKAIFDGYFIDRARAAAGGKEQLDEVDRRYFEQRPQDYLFTAQVLHYDPDSNRWRNLGIDPGAPTVGAGVAVDGDTVTLVGGELKPGLRSPHAKQVRLDGERLHWSAPSPMPAAPGDTRQEGIAGACAGYSGGVLLAAGGANFPGAWKRFDSGQLYAHRGLGKTWRADIYASVDGRWSVAGKLPSGLGYGSCVQLDEGVLLIGGELQGGAGSRDVFLMTWNGKAVELLR